MLILSFVFIVPLIGLQVYNFYKHTVVGIDLQKTIVSLTDALGVAVKFYRILGKFLSSVIRSFHTSILILRVHLLFLAPFVEGYGSRFRFMAHQNNAVEIGFFLTVACWVGYSDVSLALS